MKAWFDRFSALLLVTILLISGSCCGEEYDWTEPVMQLIQLIDKTKYADADEMYQSEIKGSILLEMEAAAAAEQYFDSLIADCIGNQVNDVMVDYVYQTMQRITWVEYPDGIDTSFENFKIEQKEADTKEEILLEEPVSVEEVVVEEPVEIEEEVVFEEDVEDELATNTEIGYKILRSLMHYDEVDEETLVQTMRQHNEVIVGNRMFADVLHSICDEIVGNPLDGYFVETACGYLQTLLDCISISGESALIHIGDDIYGVRYSEYDGSGYLAFSITEGVTGIYNTEIRDYTYTTDDYSTIYLVETDGSFALGKGEYFGNADRDGKLRISAYYEEPFGFKYDQYAVVRSNGKLGVIDTSNNIILKNEFGEVYILNEEGMIIASERKAGYNSYNGNYYQGPFCLYNNKGVAMSEAEYWAFHVVGDKIFGELEDYRSNLRYHLFDAHGMNLLMEDSPYQDLRGAEYVTMPNQYGIFEVHFEIDHGWAGSTVYFIYYGSDMNLLNNKFYSETTGFNDAGYALVREIEMEGEDFRGSISDFAHYPGYFLINTEGETLLKLKDDWDTEHNSEFEVCNAYLVHRRELISATSHHSLGDMRTGEIREWKSIEFIPGTEMVIVQELGSMLYALYDGPNQVYPPLYNEMYYNWEDGLVHMTRGAESETYAPKQWPVLTPENAEETLFPLNESEMIDQEDDFSDVLNDDVQAGEASAESCIGIWHAETVSLGGQEYNAEELLFDVYIAINADGSCVDLEAGERVEGEWSLQGGVLSAAGRSLTLTEDGCLSEETMGMYLKYVRCDAMPGL